jgi:hypothetical protein
MNATLSITASALVAAALNAAWVDDAGAQAFADSTGGSSQIHGELATTAAGIVPLASSSHPTRTSLGVEASDAKTFQRYADSTGGSSAARAAFDLDHAQTRLASADQVAAHGRFQPTLDSTGGGSAASAERVFEAAVDVAPAHGIGLAAIRPQDPAAR